MNPTLAVAARKVLADAKLGLAKLQEDLGGGSEWRLAWVMEVALLRAVGHALVKVDAGRSTALGHAIDAAWTRWKANRKANEIFFEFIDRERNNVLKEYRFTAGVGVTVHVPTKTYKQMPDGRIVDDGQIGEGKVEHEYIMTGGPFKGRDQRDLVRAAVRWWEEQLDAIESDAANLQKG